VAKLTSLISSSANAPSGAALGDSVRANAPLAVAKDRPATPATDNAFRFPLKACFICDMKWFLLKFD
jgi:hypothetical protein